MSICLKSFCLDRSPCFSFSPLPKWEEIKGSSTNFKGWSVIKVHKRGKDGKWQAQEGKPIVFRYILENATGDLYGIQQEDDSLPTQDEISLKCLAIFFATPFYAIGLVSFNLVKIGIDLLQIFLRSVKKFYQVLSEEPLLEAFFTASFFAVFEYGSALIGNIRRIASAPLFALGVMGIAAYGIFKPLKGMKSLGRLEKRWHDNAKREDDLRYRLRFRDCVFKRKGLLGVLDGKILFLGYCLLKRKNLFDLQEGKKIFKIIEKRRSFFFW